MPKTFKAFRFNPELYENFKELASGSGYTVTGALEKFMSCCVENGVLAFPVSGRAEDCEAEARVMLDWLRKSDHWYALAGEEELSVPGRLLTLLPQVHDTNLKKEIEEELRNL